MPFFNKVVALFTGGIISPLIRLIFNTDFKDLKYVIKEGIANETGKVVGEVAVFYGDIMTKVINFIIVVFVMFMVIKSINKMKMKEEEAPSVPSGPSDNDLLSEIRDLLKK